MALVTYRQRSTSQPGVQWTGSNQSAITELLGDSRFYVDTNNVLVFSDDVDAALNRVRRVALNDWLIDNGDGTVSIVANSLFSRRYAQAYILAPDGGMYALSANGDAILRYSGA